MRRFFSRRIFSSRLGAFLSIGWLLGFLGLGPACQDKTKSADQAPDPKPAETGADVSPAERTTAEPRPAAESEHRPFLYEVKKAGAEPSYLLGTMHLGFDYQELPKFVWEKLAASDAVALETDLRQMTSAAATMMKRGQLPEGESLAAKLGPEAYQKLKDELGGFPVGNLDRMQPWLVSTLLLARLFPTALPLDMAVLREAERQNKELIFLEPFEMQLDLLPKVMDAGALKQLLDPASPMRKQLAAGAEAYQKGDYDALMASAFDTAQYGGDPEILDIFIFDRNDAWVDKLLPRLTEEGGVFVAVGAAHLGEDRGLLESLKKQGFTVTRLTE